MTAKQHASARIRRGLLGASALAAVLGLVAPTSALAETASGLAEAPVLSEVTPAPTPEPSPSESPATTPEPTPVETPAPTATTAPDAPDAPGATASPDPAATSAPLPTLTLPTDPAAPVDPAFLPVVEGAPSWDAVLAASGDPVASAPIVNSLNQQLAALDQAVKDAEKTASEAGTAFQQAQNAADQRRFEVDSLDAQVADAQLRADESGEALGGMAVRLRNHTGGVDPQVIAFFDAGPQDDYLDQATTLNRFADNADDLHDIARADQAELERLQGEAQLALEDAERLAGEAQLKLDAAVAAQNALVAQRDAAVQAGAQLDVMLDVLESGREPTRADYDALLEAQRAAYAAGAAALAAAGQGGVGALGASVPMAGALKLTDGFGPRSAPAAGASSYHEGLDLVVGGGSTMGAVLYAVLPGTVTYAGPMGSYGNMVEIDLGNGTRVRYAHIADGGIGVRVGQQVTAGQPIALAGSTGVSTGAHLHFEVRVNGTAVDPVPWLRGLKVMA